MASYVKFSGNLYSHRHTFQAMADKLDQEVKDLLLQIGEMYRQSILEVIEQKGPGWDLNTPYYRRKKKYFLEKHGLPDRGPYIKTGALISTLTVEVTQDGPKRFRVWAGFKEGDHYSGLKISQLIDILDSQRPLIHPAWERVKPKANSLIRSFGQGLFN